MAKYAANTAVASEASRAEIERTLRRYGATEFAYGWKADRAVIGFAMADRHVRFELPLPDRNARRFTHTPTRGTPRSAEAQEREYEQAVRQSWRALALVIKAKLEAVDAGITTVEQEFLAHIVLPDGSTVGQWAAPQLAEVYGSRQMPQLLPGTSDRSGS